MIGRGRLLTLMLLAGTGGADVGAFRRQRRHDGILRLAGQAQSLDDHQPSLHEVHVPATEGPHPAAHLRCVRL